MTPHLAFYALLAFALTSPCIHASLTDIPPVGPQDLVLLSSDGSSGQDLPPDSSAKRDLGPLPAQSRSRLGTRHLLPRQIDGDAGPSSQGRLNHWILPIAARDAGNATRISGFRRLTLALRQCLCLPSGHRLSISSDSTGGSGAAANLNPSDYFTFSNTRRTSTNTPTPSSTSYRRSPTPSPLAGSKSSADCGLCLTKHGYYVEGAASEYAMKVHGQPVPLSKNHPWQRLGQTMLVTHLDLRYFLQWALHHISPANTTARPNIRREDLSDINKDITQGKPSSEYKPFINEIVPNWVGLLAFMEMEMHNGLRGPHYVDWSHHSSQILRGYLQLFEALFDQYNATVVIIAEKLARDYPQSPDLKLFDNYMVDRFKGMYEYCEESARNKENGSSNQGRRSEPDVTHGSVRRATSSSDYMDQVTDLTSETSEDSGTLPSSSGSMEDRSSGLTFGGHIVRDANSGAQFYPTNSYPLSGFGMELDDVSDGSQQDVSTST